MFVLVAGTAGAAPVATAGWARGVVPTATAEVPGAPAPRPSPAPAVPATPSAPAPTPATAAPATAPDVNNGEGPMRPEAQALYARGLERFGARDYADAIADFAAGYAIEPRREFLFANGQAKRLAGDCKGAVALYQRFLATNPSSVQANATQMALGRCAQHLADHPDIVVVEPPKPLPLPPPPPPRWWLDPWAIGASGAGVVALGVGAGFVVAAYSARDDAQAATILGEERERWSAATSRRTVGVVALGAGSMLVAAGTYRFLTLKRAADRRDVFVSVTPGMVSVGGNF